MNFLKLINEIESELKIEHVGGAISWADKKYNNAYSNAIDRFDIELSKAITSGDYEHAKRESDVYKKTTIGFLREYKTEKRLSDSDSFLASIRRK